MIAQTRITVTSAVLDADAALERLLARRAESPGDAGKVEAIFAATHLVLAELIGDEVYGERLALAGTTVEINLVDAPSPTAFSMLLDRHPVELVEGSYPDAEVKLYMTADDLAAFWSGELHAAIAITDGRIGYRGPVRKVLRVLPIVRRQSERFTQQVQHPLGGGER
ncbi:MAG: hypothetical protein ACYDHH_04425 [Solirubrobacteraceae bacterium]